MVLDGRERLITFGEQCMVTNGSRNASRTWFRMAYPPTFKLFTTNYIDWSLIRPWGSLLSYAVLLEIEMNNNFQDDISLMHIYINLFTYTVLAISLKLHRDVCLLRNNGSFYSMIVNTFYQLFTHPPYT